MRDLATAEAGESFPKSDCVVVASCSRYVGLLEDVRTNCAEVGAGTRYATIAYLCIELRSSRRWRWSDVDHGCRFVCDIEEQARYNCIHIRSEL